MTGSSKRPAPSTPPPENKDDLDRILDEALKETFPASDPPAILQPARTPRWQTRSNQRPPVD